MEQNPTKPANYGHALQALEAAKNANEALATRITAKGTPVTDNKQAPLRHFRDAMTETAANELAMLGITDVTAAYETGTVNEDCEV